MSLVLMAALLSAAPGSSAAEDGRKAPNVLFLFADDHAFDAVGYVGNEEIRTPNIDRLAAQGTTFTHAYNMGAWGGAVCVASRTMLVTGRSLFHARADNRDLAERYLQTEQTWPQLMAQAGYRTAMSGKWHVSMDARKAFQQVLHLRGGMPNQTEAGYDRPRDDRPDPWDPADPSFGGFWKGGRHWSEVVADDLCALLQEQGAAARAAGGNAAAPDTARDEAARPFFFYTAFNAPHDPRQSPRAILDTYPPGEITLPAPFLPVYPHHEAMGAGKRLRDERLAPFPRTAHAVQVHRAEYYSAITHMDQQIGRILDALEASGQADNTWIFYTADHGLACGHHGLLGKQNMYEHSMRVPFLVVGPGVRAGAKVDAPIYLQDVMPTTLELAGAQIPEQVEFQSLLPHLRAPDQAAARDQVFGSYMDQQRMLSAGGHKLILYPRAKAWRLFDLEADPDEAQDLAGRPESLPRARELYRRLRAEQARLEDALDLDGVYPDLAGQGSPWPAR